MELSAGHLKKKCIEIAVEVYRDLGRGWDEIVYQKAMEVELRLAHIKYESQRVLNVWYKGYSLGWGLIDLLIDGRLIIEVKATPHIKLPDVAQINKYKKSLDIPDAIIINFMQDSYKIVEGCENSEGVEYILVEGE